MKKRAVSTERAPQAVGPYSQAIVAGDYIFCAGQVAIDPQQGKLIEGDVAVQTGRVLENLRAVLEAAGSSLDRVVKTMVFMVNLDDFQTMNRVYAEYFQDGPPARSTIQVARLPLGALIEIEAVALRD